MLDTVINFVSENSESSAEPWEQCKQDQVPITAKAMNN